MQMKTTNESILLDLKQIEVDLNDIHFRNIPIGSLLAKFFSILYLRYSGIYKHEENTYKSLKYIGALLKFTANGLFKNKSFSKTEKHILINKLSDRKHLQRMINPLINEFKTNAVIYTPSDENQIIPYNFTNKLTIKNFIAISKKTISNINTIQNAFSTKGITINRWELIYTIFTQLIITENWIRFFKQNNIKLVVIDFDRDFSTSSMVLAAKQVGVKTVTLVHGILNPPFAYVPVLADIIFCWGNYQKTQLLSYGVPEDKIVITGNPIAEDNKLVNELNRNDKLKRIIGVGLNPMPENKNIEMLNFLFNNLVDDDHIEWVIKLHPAMRKEHWNELIIKNNVEILDSKDITNDVFFELIDLLIVGNSGLGFEAISANVPVWVYRVSDGKSGNDGVMIEEANAPDIRIESVLKSEFQLLFSSDKYLIDLLKKQKNFVNGEFYFASGNQAVKNIINEINKIIEK